MSLFKFIGLNVDKTKDSIKEQEVTIQADGELYYYKKDKIHVRHPKLAKDKPKRPKRFP